MPRVINITDKLSNERPAIKVGNKEYQVNNSVLAVTKFQELAGDMTADKMEEAVVAALGKEAAKGLKVKEMSLSNFKVLSTAILAAMLDIEYEEAERRFRGEGA